MCLGKNHKCHLLLIACHKGHSHLTGIFACWHELVLPCLLCAFLASSRISWGNWSNLPFMGTYLCLEGYCKIGYASKCGYACDVIIPNYRRKWSLHHSIWNVQEMEQKRHFCLERTKSFRTGHLESAKWEILHEILWNNMESSECIAGLFSKMAASINDAVWLKYCVSEKK